MHGNSHRPKSVLWRRVGGGVARRVAVAGRVGRPGRPACGSSFAGNDPIPGRSSRSPTPAAGGSRPSPPTPKSASSPTSRPGTAPTPASRTGSAAPRTPGWPTCPPAAQRQHRLVRARRPRLRPTRLDPAAAPRRRSGHCRAEAAALPAAARGRPPGPQRTTTAAPDRPQLALERRAHQRLHPAHRPAAAGPLTANSHPYEPDGEAGDQAGRFRLTKIESSPSG